jgi:hypothetical protein
MSDVRKIPSKLKMPADWDEALDGEWDDEMASPEAIAEGANIQLIVEYLNKRLEPEKMEAVRKRLVDDEAFAKLAEPIIYIWSIPTHLERHPRPAGELERHWDEFTKRAGFAHQRRKTRRRRLWLLGLVLFVVGASGFAFRRPFTEWFVTQRDYDVVALDGRDGWIPLKDSLFIDPAPGASLRVRREPVEERLHVILDGEARFLVARRDTTGPTLFHRGIVLHTRAGTASTHEAEFTVTSRSDSTIVEVHRPSKRTYFWFIPYETSVELRHEHSDPEAPLKLGERERGRLVRGKDEHPIKLPSAKEP